MITAVLFDLDETLLDRTTSLVAFLGDQHSRFAAGLGSGSFETWRDRFLEFDARGRVPKAVVYRSLLAEFHGDASLAETLLSDYRTRCSRFARPCDGMASTLMLLRAKGLRLGVVTNGETEFQVRHVEALGLDSLVDAVLVSQTEGFRKPDAALFRLAAGRLGVELANCLFVGDNPVADILGADGAGMATAWFRCGQEWPPALPPTPGFVIDRLSDLLELV